MATSMRQTVCRERERPVCLSASTDGSYKATNGPMKNDIFWKSEDCSTSHAYIPGVDMNGNKKARKMKWQTCKAVHFKSPPSANTRRTENLTSFPANLMSDPKASRLSDRISTSSKLSNDKTWNKEEHSKILLKDLCQEDKLRVTHLIFEIAKLGDERDNANEQLSKERGNFEVQMKRLTGQLETLTDDHKQILCKMMDCQHLLSIYQHLLTELQEQKTNHIADRNPQENINAKENVQHGEIFQDYSCEPAVKQQSVFNTAECVSNPNSPCNFPSGSCNSHSRSCFSLPATMPLSDNSNTANPRSSKSLNIHSLRKLPHHKRFSLVSHVVRKDLKPAQHIFKTSPRDESNKCASVEMPGGRHLKDFRESGVKSVSSQKGHTTSEMNCTEEFGDYLANDKINISKTRHPLHAEQIISSKGYLEKPKSRFRKLNDRRLRGPLQEPIMSSTQRSSEFGYSGSICSRNTVDNVVRGVVSQNSSRSAFSLPETLQSYKRLEPLNSSNILLSKNNIHNNYAKDKKSSLRSSLQSLPNVLLQAAHSRNSDLTNKAVLSHQTNEEGRHNTSFQSNSSKTSDADLLPNNLNAEQFCQLDFEERREFLVRQRELLNEERNRLMSILNHPDIKPLELDTISNCKKSKPEISLTNQTTPIRCQDKENSSNIHQNIESSRRSQLVPKGPCEEVASSPHPGDLPNELNVEDSASVASRASICSKQSSLCLADLIDSIEFDIPQPHKHHISKNSHRLSPKRIGPFQSDKLEERFESEILNDVFFLN